MAAVAASAQTPPPPVQATIDVVSVTPVDGEGIDADKYPSNVRVIKPGRNGIASDPLMRRGASIQASEAQSNRYQPDIEFRGFVASPLLGTPQGVAVFQDGVRVNEPFGDVVNWDTLSQSIASIEIIPGSDAAFGLNALGGVIALRTKTGFSDPGPVANASGGSFGWSRFDASAGWTRGALGYFVAATHEHDGGWRDASPSRLDQSFGSVQWVRDHGSSDARLTISDNDLTGNGSVPVQLFAIDRRAVFTTPDATKNHDVIFSSAHDFVLPFAILEVNGSIRRSLQATRNGDESPYVPCAVAALALCDEGGQPIVDQFGMPATITSAHPLDAVLNDTSTRQTAAALTTQIRRHIHVNDLIAGIAVDHGSSAFSSDTELADLTASRGTSGTGRIASGSIVSLDARTSNDSIYGTDVITLAHDLTATVAVRMNRSAIELVDLAGDALTGNHRFTSINPSAGFARALTHATLFGSVSQSSRTPTPVELTCASPDAPCRLPNAFVADPSLRQVIGRTGELGLRGRTSAVKWSAAAFRSLSSDDIVFVSSGPARGEGYFTNVGSTRRQGVEIAVDGNAGRRLDWFAAYSLVDATFGDDFTVASPNNPFASSGEIAVTRGDRLPLVPRNTVKVGLEWRATDSLRLSCEARHFSESYFRGDEANRAAPLAGYSVLDVSASLRATAHLGLELSVRNITNASYATFGVFGDATGVLGPQFDDPRFISPGEPRRVELAVRLR